MLSFPWRKWFNTINLPPGHCLVTPGNGAISGAQCQLWYSAAVVARSVLVSEVHAAEPMTTSISATMATLFMGHDRDVWGKRLTVYRMLCVTALAVLELAL